MVRHPSTYDIVPMSGSGNYYKVCMTTNQPNKNSNPNYNPTTKQQAIVSIQLNIVVYSTYQRYMYKAHSYYFP